MAGSGLKKSSIISSCKTITNKINSIQTKVGQLANNISELNAKGWYGGKAANNWYNNASKNINNLDAYLVKLQTFNNKLNAKAKKIGSK